MAFQKYWKGRVLNTLHILSKAPKRLCQPVDAEDILTKEGLYIFVNGVSWNWRLTEVATSGGVIWSCLKPMNWQVRVDSSIVQQWMQKRRTVECVEFMRRTEQRQVVQIIKALIIFINHLFYVMKFNGVKLSALILSSGLHSIHIYAMDSILFNRILLWKPLQFRSIKYNFIMKGRITFIPKWFHDVQ